MKEPDLAKLIYRDHVMVKHHVRDRLAQELAALGCHVAEEEDAEPALAIKNKTASAAHRHPLVKAIVKHLVEDGGR